MRTAHRLHLLCVTVFLLFAQAAVWGQAETATKQVNRIPRRVFFSYARSVEPQILPFFADALWFPSKNHGMLFSLMTDVRDSDGDPDTEVLLFPGIGYSYRTLGRVAAGFDFSLYGGHVFGLEETSFYTLMSISPSVSYNFTPSLGMTCKLASLYFSWDAFFGRNYGDMMRNVMFQQILGLGLVYRPGK